MGIPGCGKSVLVTGFGPFPGVPVNPSEAAVNRMAEHHIRRNDVAFRVLPTAYRQADAEILAAIGQIKPAVVLLTGFDRHARGLRLETRAANAVDPQLPDALGVRARGSTVDPDAPATLAATHSPERMASALATTSAPWAFSHDAGRYLCNYIFFRVLRFAQHNDHAFRAAFVHIPPLRDAMRAGDGNVSAGCGGGTAHPLSLPLLDRALAALIDDALVAAGEKT